VLVLHVTAIPLMYDRLQVHCNYHFKRTPSSAHLLGGEASLAQPPSTPAPWWTCSLSHDTHTVHWLLINYVNVVHVGPLWASALSHVWSAHPGCVIPLSSWGPCFHPPTQPPTPAAPLS
jgi:hypothetical protein